MSPQLIILLLELLRLLQDLQLLVVSIGGTFVIPTGNTAGRTGVNTSTGDFRLNTQTSKIEYYSDSEWKNISVSQPLINNITPSTFNGAAGTNITIIGNNFVTGANVHFVSSANGSVTAAGSVTFNSATQLTAVTPALTVAGEPYGIRVTNPDGGMTLLEAIGCRICSNLDYSSRKFDNWCIKRSCNLE